MARWPVRESTQEAADTPASADGSGGFFTGAVGSMSTSPHFNGRPAPILGRFRGAAMLLASRDVKPLSASHSESFFNAGRRAA